MDISDSAVIADEVEHRMRKFHTRKLLAEWGLALALGIIFAVLWRWSE